MNHEDETKKQENKPVKHTIRNSILAILAVVIIFGFSACGYRFYNSSLEEKAEYFSEKITEKLDLTTQQNEKLLVLKQQLLALAKKMRQAKQQHHDELLGVIANEHFDRNAANKMLIDKSQKITIEGPPIITAVADFYDSLDPNQQQKIRAEFAEHSKKSCHGFGSRYFDK